MRILITGAGGFIGRHLTARLVDRHEVFALVRHQGVVDLPEGARILVHDLTSPLDKSQLPTQVDVVIHLAQSSHYRSFPEFAQDIVAVNIQSTARMLDYARLCGAKTFILASTGGVYPRSDMHVTEAAPLEAPDGFYDRTKYIAELLAHGYEEVLRVVVLRFFCVYGPGQKDRLVPGILERIRSNQEVVIDGSPGLRLNPIYVEDAVRAFEPAFELGLSATFNIAGDEDVTIDEMARLLAGAVNQRLRLRHTGGKGSHALLGDNTKMKQVLGITPQVDLRTGLQRLVSASEAKRIG
ncbi:NAD(P)-dependent oxidoreductase [Candidatus Bipolaricaulota bacterium]|nr:NAD(P)-dependent oxidoreductase [Candidatus Bipolaricaulota bacterium]